MKKQGQNKGIIRLPIRPQPKRILFSFVYGALESSSSDATGYRYDPGYRLPVGRTVPVWFTL